MSFFKQHKFNKKFATSTFGFTFVSDNTNQVKDGIFYNLICVQGLIKPKFLFICPPDTISFDKQKEYTEALDYTKFISKPIKDIKEITNLVKDNYSVFIYDLKKCFELKILTPSLYKEYISYATNHFVEQHHLKHASLILPFYKGFQPPLRYVTDVTGLNEPIYSSKYPKKLIKDKIVQDEKETGTTITIPDPCHEFYLYNDTEKEYKKTEELSMNLFWLTLKLNDYNDEKAKGHWYELSRSPQKN